MQTHAGTHTHTHTHRGASAAMVLSFTSLPLLLLVYMYARGLHKQTWDGWSWESLREWGQYIKLGAPGLLMLSCEWWCFEILAFVAGSINKTQLGINSILLNILLFLFMVSQWVLPYSTKFSRIELREHFVVHKACECVRVSTQEATFILWVDSNPQKL